jgi:hypothetical protein
MLLLLLAAIERLDHLNGEVVALRLVLEGARDRLAWFDQDAVDPDAGGAVT